MINDLIWIMYIGVSGFVFRFSASVMHTLMERWQFFFLALSLMAFGCGRFLYAISPKALPTYEWIFGVGHVSLLTFATLFILCAYNDESPLTAWRNMLKNMDRERRK